MLDIESDEYAPVSLVMGPCSFSPSRCDEAKATKPDELPEKALSLTPRFEMDISIKSPGFKL